MEAIARRRAEPPTIGVYLHVPFCERVCPYCDFAVVAARPIGSAREARMVEAMLRELSHRAAHLSEFSLASIYFGGGTPSLLEAESIARLVEGVRGAFAPARGAVEITLETNPSTVERARLSEFRAAGVNRLSVGVQSFDDRILKRLGRAHAAAESHATLEAARAAGFEEVSIDLIYGVPDASPEQLDRDLDALEAHAPEHVSVYELTIEEGTPFALAEARGQLRRPDEDGLVAQGDQVEARLVAAGLERYEISSYARVGHEARHNRRYWRREPVLGLGMSAWSSLPAAALAKPHDAPFGIREANERDLEAYLGAVERAGTAVASEERASAETARGEAVFLGLRQVREGLDTAAFEAEFGAPIGDFYAEQLRALFRDGLIESEPPGHLRLTRRGRRFADSVAAAFV